METATCIFCHSPHSQYPEPDLAHLIQGLEEPAKQAICLLYSIVDTSSQTSTQTPQDNHHNTVPESQPALESSVPEDNMCPFAKNGMKEDWFGPPSSFDSFDGGMEQLGLAKHQEHNTSREGMEIEAGAAQRQRQEVELSTLEAARDQYVRELQAQPTARRDPMKTMRKRTQTEEWKKRNSLRKQLEFSVPLGSQPCSWRARRESWRRKEFELRLGPSERQLRFEEQQEVDANDESKAKRRRTGKTHNDDDDLVKRLIKKRISELEDVDPDFMTELRTQQKEAMKDTEGLKSLGGGVERKSVQANSSKSLWSRVIGDIRGRWAARRESSQSSETRRESEEIGSCEHKRNSKEPRKWEMKKQRAKDGSSYTWSSAYRKSNLAKELKLNGDCETDCVGGKWKTPQC